MMIRTKAYLCIGIVATLLGAVLLTNHDIRDASAQQSTTERQATNQDQQQVDQQPAAPSERPTAQARSANPNRRGWRASEIVGMDVRGNSGNDEIGEISDVMIGADGNISYVAVSFGGFLGLGDKLFAVPWKAVQFVREGDEEDDVFARINVTEEQLRTRRGFNEDNWPAQADDSFLPNASRTPRQVERPRSSTQQNQNVPR